MTKEAGSGATGQKKKGKMKLAWDAVRLMEEYGFDSVEEMRAALTAKPADLPPPPPPVEDDFIPDKITGPAEGEIVDPLDWITVDHGGVWVVCKSMSLSLRPSRVLLNPPLQQVMISANQTGEWRGCPFDMRGRNDEETRRNRINYAQWGHFCITRDLAEQCYDPDRYPLPDRAVIVPSEFRGWSAATYRPLGTLRPLKNPDPLRERVRYVLQRLPGRAFIDLIFHPEIPLNMKTVANPYGNSLGSLNIRVVATTTADKDIPVMKL